MAVTSRLETARRAADLFYEAGWVAVDSAVNGDIYGFMFGHLKPLEPAEKDKSAFDRLITVILQKEMPNFRVIFKDGTMSVAKSWTEVVKLAAGKLECQIKPYLGEV